MIAYLDGILKKVHDDKVTLLVGGIGYEVLIPFYVMNEIIRRKKQDGKLSLFISYHQTERQPKPVLVGFNSDLDKEFFELFISVEDIGPMAAVKALTKPVREIARDIEERDIKALKQLKGIGERKAEKIVATLRGKVAKYALMREAYVPVRIMDDFRKEVENVLVTKLGYKVLEARQFIEEVLKRNLGISSAEELFEEIYRGQKQ